MSEAARLRAQRAAAEYLRQLLLRPGPYRDEWRRHVAKPRDDVINQLAVAEVIAAHQNSSHAHPGEAQMQPYQLRDIVSGALSGRQLNADTLQLFVGAFGFSPHEAGRLARLWNGSTAIGVMSGTHAFPMAAEQNVNAAIGPRQHQTLSLHDHIWVGTDGRIDRGRTLQVIEAIAPGVDRIPFLCDTNVLTLEVGQGCKELAGQVRRIGADVFATEFLLARTLEAGETLTLEYWLSYRWPGDANDPAEREYRRAVMRQLHNLDMRIEFHPDKLPSGIWCAVWDGVDGDILEQERVTLDMQNSAHRYFRSLEKTVVGFHWRWD